MPRDELNISYSGARAPIFWLSFRTAFLTVLTLGFYRFWAKTRLRRYYWSAIRPGGVPLEYVGDPLEKLLGFLIAVVFMAFYIGVVNLILMFFSFTFLNDNFAAYVVSFLGLTPIIFFAQYRARRYILARTRWRGIRFGLEPGAWGYCWRAIVHWIASICTLGVLWPLTTLWLEKYRVSRTYFGDQRFHQGGAPGLLFGAMRYVYLSVIVCAVAVGMIYQTENPIWVVPGLVSGLWLLYGLAYWRAESFRRMAQEKSLGEMRFHAHPRAWRIVGIYALAGVMMSIVTVAMFVAFLFLLGVLVGATDPSELEYLATQASSQVLVPFGVMVYFLILVLFRAMTHAWITLPIARHFAEVTQIENAGQLSQIVQRARDEFAEAEGFADALDVGAAI